MARRYSCELSEQPGELIPYGDISGVGVGSALPYEMATHSLTAGYRRLSGHRLVRCLAHRPALSYRFRPQRKPLPPGVIAQFDIAIRMEAKPG